jgi:hypothetical protein
MEMPWIYSQSSGFIIQNVTGNHLGKGYSGKGIYCNVPTYEHLKDEGTIPRGKYKIGKAFHHHKTGQYTMRLTPVGHNAHGRTGLLIHGDSKDNPGGASTGCIVLPLHSRMLISASKDTDLEVIL